MGLQHEDQLGGDVGQDQGVGVLLVSEWSWLIPVQVERAEPHRSDPQREAEDRSDSRVKDWLGEGQPAGAGGPGQVRFQHGPVFAVGIDAGSLPEAVLELLDESTDRVARAHRAPRDIAGHQHDPGTVHASDLGADLTDTPRLHLRAIPIRDEQGDDPEPSLTAHRRAPKARATVRYAAERGFDETPLSTTGCSRDCVWCTSHRGLGQLRDGRSFERHLLPT